ncbi:MAG TPA: uroporphyrinogen decarboxylase family protein [Candidatus Paceibacterota bacterium]|nr:uroporphyrinogen decarboxylase family protein [Verrucomicrobiota bacterium]HRZ46143.1 uroporphyrinogen decarboxylase family protein [Candidatus Paceibacterota bacterium]HRZ92930.1 uroporphyrinogen decarboxylase family protein [Candidatus Paceibacterota bacterium]
MNAFNQIVLGSPRRLAMPIAVYPALALTGAKVADIVTNPRAQLEAQEALQQRYHWPFVLTAMDLSAEAEAFGCAIAVSESEVPTVTGRRIASREQAEALPVPQPGDGRTGVYLESVQLFRRMTGRPFVFGGCIGPFSLAARLVGVSEALELTVAEPDWIRIVVEKAAAFLSGYIRAFREAGADGILMAEPAAGLLSPRGMSAFSSAYIRRIALEAGGGSFCFLLHNCAARMPHLHAILETGLETFHFGAPMDIVGALGKVPPDVVVCGNLDPAGVFVQLPPAEVRERAVALRAAAAARRNFVISSGCDLPPGTPIASLDAFDQAVSA